MSSPFFGVPVPTPPALTLLPSGLLAGPPGDPPSKLLLLNALAVTAGPAPLLKADVGVCGVGGEGDASEDERNGDVFGPN